MELQIDIYQRRGRNMHLVLRGRAGGEASCDDPDVFAQYTEIYQAFTGRLSPPPKAFDAEGESYVTQHVPR